VTECRSREVSERLCREEFEDLTLLQTRGSELCHAIIGPPRARHHLTEGMWLAALHNTEMDESLPCFEERCLLLRSRCLGTDPVTPSP
jgi:hypothetical protein